MLQEFLEKHQISSKKIAVAVSGGADSLAAVLMCQEECAPLNCQIIAITVDHGLRPSSKDEALYVKKVMQENGIEHVTLVWKGQKPKTGVEEAARTARYDLIENWCYQNKITYLITAHHLYDQAETFLMRLERGSGLDGLCAMKEKTSFKHISILRPFLSTNPNVFKNELQKRHIPWVEDESNQDKKLLRVRMRQFLPILEEKTGITPEKIILTVQRLQSTRAYFENKIQTTIKNNFRSFGHFGYSCNFVFFQTLDAEIQYRLLGFILKTIGKTEYPPEAQKVLLVLEKLKAQTFKSTTLNYCQIIRRDNVLWFLREKSKMQTNSKEAWQKYVEKNPKYKKMKIPALLKYLLISSED